MSGPASAGGAVPDLDMHTAETAAAVNALGMSAEEYRQTISTLLAGIEEGEAAIGAAGGLTDALAQKFAAEYGKMAHLKASLVELGLRLENATTVGQNATATYVESDLNAASVVSSVEPISGTTSTKST